MKKRKILKTALLVAVVGLILWRLVPRPFSHFLPEGEVVSRLDCTALVLGGTWGLDPDAGTHTLQCLTPEDEAFAQIAGLLGSTGYRPDFRNLLPWPRNSVEADSRFDGRSVMVFLVWGDSLESSATLHLQTESQAVVSLGTEDGFRIYHPTDPEAHAALAADWRSLGPGAFSFQALEELERGPEQTEAAFKADLEALAEIWREKLAGSGTPLY